MQRALEKQEKRIASLELIKTALVKQVVQLETELRDRDSIYIEQEERIVTMAAEKQELAADHEEMIYRLNSDKDELKFKVRY